MCSRNALRGADLLAYRWTDSDFTTATLGSNLLVAWAALQPQHVPPAPRASQWAFDSGARAHVVLLPAMPDCKDIVVCGNVPIAKLTVKAAYSFLLRRDFADRRSAPRDPLKLPRIFPLINDAQLTKRWQWIASSPLPAKVRQTL